MKRHLNALLVVAIASAASIIPLPSNAATSSSPVKVIRCEPRQHPFDPPAGYTGAYYPPGGEFHGVDVYGNPLHESRLTRATPTLAIDYMNEGSKPIKQIDFGLVSSGKLLTEARDVGTFAPGVQIKHEFAITEEALLSSSSQCVPLQAIFADGSTWRNPHLPKS